MLKVLIVDDSAEIRDISKFYFESIGDFSFLSASSAAEAIAIIEKNPDIDAVFSDYHMPDGDGVVVLKYLRKSSQAPFLLHTGDEWVHLTEVLAHTNVYHAEKPLDLGQLENILTLALKDKSKKNTAA